MNKMSTTYPGDTILKEDMEFMTSDSSQEYIVYPSRDVPRFIIPASDITAQRFIIRMMSADQGIAGFMLRIIMNLPGGLFLLRGIFFRERVHVGAHD